LRVNKAIEDIAKGDVEKLKHINQRSMKKEKSALEQKFGQKFDNIDKIRQRLTWRLNAKRYITENQMQHQRESMKDWRMQQEEIEERQNKKCKQERLQSAKAYRRSTGQEDIEFLMRDAR
jgi:hypothetical protein